MNIHTETTNNTIIANIMDEHHDDGQDFAPPSIGDNGLDKLRKEFFKQAQRLGKLDGAGSSAMPEFFIATCRAAADGLLELEPPKTKKGEPRVKSDAELAYSQYLAAKGKIAADVAALNQDSFKKQVSYLKKGIELGVYLGHEGVRVLETTRRIINEESQAAAEAKAQGDKAAKPIPGGVYNNLYKIAVENLRKEDGQPIYINDEGDGVRAMTEDEIYGALVPEEKQEKTELEDAMRMTKAAEAHASKYQSPENEAAYHAYVSRLKELQTQYAKENGIELNFNTGDKPKTIKEMNEIKLAGETLRKFRAAH